MEVKKGLGTKQKHSLAVQDLRVPSVMMSKLKAAVTSEDRLASASKLKVGNYLKNQAHQDQALTSYEITWGKKAKV